jgi:murein DD-endopeptidase MepM/ murein hydrolase activator NlpD
MELRQGERLSLRPLISESTAKVIRRGTLIPPTYVKPLYGGIFSSPFGYRWGRLHEGVDWACPIGSAVFASCGGVVTSAGWSSGYGYQIVIRHPDGKRPDMHI